MSFYAGTRKMVNYGNKGVKHNKKFEKSFGSIFLFSILVHFQKNHITKTSTCNHSHWTCPRWHQIYKPFNKVGYQKTVIHFNKYTFGLKLDTEVNHEIVTRNFWYKSISVQSTIKQTTTKKLTGTLPLEGYSSFVTLFFLNFAIGNLFVLFNTI